ncbi:MAG: hypothetical protein K0R27_1469 [Xanthobacteraceae bacterium]|jgi:hypothetical protein|nr:hypothetical protein [Xanthobacteraceae bacterium]
MADVWDQFPDAPPREPADLWAQFPDAPVQAAPAVSAAPKPAPPQPFNSTVPYSDRPIGARVLGAPIDGMNYVLDALGAPTSEKPFMGSAQFDDVIQAITGTREAEDIAKARPDLASQGGAGAGQRAYASFMNTPEARERYFDSEFGPQGQGWYYLNDRFGNRTDRVVTRGPDGKETLFNPPGVDMGDVASMAGGVPDFAGAVVGGAASVPAYAAGPAVGITATAATSSGLAQLFGEAVGRLFPENRAAEPSVVEDVLPRAGQEAATDALIGVLTGGAGRIGNAVLNKVRAPFAPSASDPLAAEFRAATDRLQGQGYDVRPLPSESGAGGFVPRMEGMLEKLPGSAEKMRQNREAGDLAISRYQEDMVGGAAPAAVGRDVVSELGTQRKNLIIDQNEALARADDAIAGNEAALTSRQGPQMSTEAAGQQARGGLERARNEFRTQTGQLYDAARNAPGGRDAIVDMTPVREQVAQIRSSLPPTRERIVDGQPVAGGPSAEFTPQGLNRLLTGVDDIADTISIDQARQMRSIVSDAIDDKTILPGVPERNLLQLRQSLTAAIDGSVERAGSPALRNALGQANSYYRDNVDRFSRSGVRETYLEPTQTGFVEDNQIVSRLLSGRGNPGAIREIRDTMGAESPEWAATRRNAIEQILDTGRNKTLYGRRVVDMNGLNARLNSLDDETVQELFGVSNAQQLRNLAADISNRTRYLDADAMSNSGSPSILGQLRAAAVADDQIAREYRDGVIGPFLRGETGAPAKMQPEELIPWLYRKAAPGEARQVLDKLSVPVRAQVERGIVADVVESAISKGRGDLGDVRRLVTGTANPADSTGLAEILGAGGDAASRQQSARVEALLSPESRQALRDLALITAKRQQRDATTSAIGGLAAGAAMTGILAKPMSALHAAAISRGLAQAITSEPVRRWLTNTRRVTISPTSQAQMVATAPALADVLVGALGESEDVQAAADWLREGESQIDALGKRVSRPPEGAGSWEQFFSGGAQ